MRELLIILPTNISDIRGSTSCRCLSELIPVVPVNGKQSLLTAEMSRDDLRWALCQEKAKTECSRRKASWELSQQCRQWLLQKRKVWWNLNRKVEQVRMKIQINRVHCQAQLQVRQGSRVRPYLRYSLWAKEEQGVCMVTIELWAELLIEHLGRRPSQLWEHR